MEIQQKFPWIPASLYTYKGPCREERLQYAVQLWSVNQLRIVTKQRLAKADIEGFLLRAVVTVIFRVFKPVRLL
jgi:hypothetical protein